MDLLLSFRRARNFFRTRSNALQHARKIFTLSCRQSMLDVIGYGVQDHYGGRNISIRVGRLFSLCRSRG